MKNYYLLALFLLPALLPAQHWTPLVLNDTLHYRTAGDAEISATFFPVSYSAVSGDTTFQFNTLGCESCLTITNGPGNCDTCYGLRNQPVPVGGYSLQKTVGGICTFSGADVRVLHTLAALGDTWTFAPAQAITAQVIAATTGLVLGQPDSLKTALLSSGDTVVWSATHGIVQWPEGFGNNRYHRLSGIQNRALGDRLLTMADIYDFQPGDVFQYYSNQFEPSTSQLRTVWAKYTVTLRQNFTDSIHYVFQITKKTMLTNVTSNPPTTTVTYTVVPAHPISVITCAAHHTNQPNHTLVEPRLFDTFGVFGTPHFGCPDTSNGGGWLEYHYYHDSLGIAGATFGKPLNQGQLVFWFPLSPTSDTLLGWGDSFSPVIPFPVEFSLVKQVRYLKGLGIVEASWSQLFEFSRYELLEGYVKNGDTVGMIYTDSWLLNTPETNRVQFQVYPNPASTSVRVELPDATPATLQVLNLQGELLHTISGAQHVYTLATESLAAGLYLMRVQTETGVAVQRLVIQH